MSKLTHNSSSPYQGKSGEKKKGCIFLYISAKNNSSRLISTKIGNI